MLKLTATDSFYVFDNYGMLTVKSNKLSWRDSIGMTVCAWIAYGRPWQLGNAISTCLWRNGFNDKWQLKRHPGYKEQSSRDHWSYYIIFERLRIIYNPEHFKHMISNFPSMRGLYLWMHSLTGNKRAEGAYYTLYIPGAIIGNVWLKFCRWVGRIKPERGNKFWIFRGEENNNPTCGELLLWRRTKWQKLWAWIIFQTIPAYPLHNRGWQLYVMPDSKRKERLKSILLKRVGESNILLRLLFEPNIIYNTKYWKSSCKLVTQQEVDNYPHMTGFRPSVYLDETCRRTIREITEQESEYNTYERDLILYLWKTKN